MARHQSKAQQETIGRVMHEFKHGELETSGGRTVENPKQAIAIALHEAGASRDESPADNRQNLARTKRRERQGGAGSRGGGKTRAELYEQAKRRGVQGRSRMSKDELERALRQG
jgi:Family of unknown function (DUF6496)